MKRVFKFFISLEDQERWLNLMSAEGWRLVKVNLFTYTFKQNKPSDYVYKVKFVGDKTKEELNEYLKFLRQQQITFYRKGMNLGKISYGSIRWRPYGRKGGVIATSPGTINSEILILELENNNDQFNIYSDDENKNQYYLTVRNVYLLASLLLTLTFLLSTPTPGQMFNHYLLYQAWDYKVIFKVLNLLIMVIFYINLYRIMKKISELKKEGKK